MKRVICLMTVWFVSVSMWSQSNFAKINSGEIPVEQVWALVERFQKNCQSVADASIPYGDKIEERGIIEMALSDFWEDATIEITNFDGTSQPSKSIKDYLYKLALLTDTRYSRIQITTVQAGIASEFRKDPNRKGWYVGYINVQQTFTADTKEGFRLSDVIVRKFKVYARKWELQSADKVYWDIKLGSITAKSIEVHSPHKI